MESLVESEQILMGEEQFSLVYLMAPYFMFGAQILNLFFRTYMIVLLALPQIRPLSYLCPVNFMFYSLNPIYPLRVSFLTPTVLKNCLHMKAIGGENL